MHWVLQEKIEPSPSTTVCIQRKTLKVVYLSLWCLVSPFEPGKFMQKCLKVLLSSNFCIQCYISVLIVASVREGYGLTQGKVSII